MANQKDEKQNEPKGLGEHNRGREAEIASEQGWDTNEEQRTEQPKGRPEHYGGKGFDYGAQDFGDTATRKENPQGESEETKKKAS